MLHHPLEAINGKRLNGYWLHIESLTELQKSGWRGFTLLLQHSDPGFLTSPVVKGIYSIGGKDGVQPWMDIQYWEVLDAQASPTTQARCIYLTSHGLDTKLFKALSMLIPSGGHMMVSYEDEQAIHRETMRSLHIGMPPVATRLGFLLFVAGFQYVKNWYLAEGGHEGPRKLWAEKALNATVARDLLRRTEKELQTYLARQLCSTNDWDATLNMSGRKRALQALHIIHNETHGKASHS